MKRLFVFVFLLVASACSSPPSSIYRSTANETAAWLRSVQIESDQGLSWPVDPDAEEPAVVTNLYSGTPGVVLFFLEAYYATGDSGFLADARGGADFLVATLPETPEPFQTGLYTGVAGTGFTLTETYKATGDAKYLEAARKTVQQLGSSARQQEAGIDWSDSTDIVSGTAGIGLYLLYAARELEIPSALKLATQAGERLVAQGIAAEEGLKWTMTPSFARLMPNFSHGTAGNAYFLARLAQATGQDRFLDAALAGGRYLTHIAHQEGGVCLVMHHEPEGDDLFYLGWCHGPVGTARLFFELHRATSDPVWLEWTKKSANGILASGVPEKQTPGYWNNVGQCCGAAGVADFFLDLHEATGNEEYQRFAGRVAEDVVARKSPSDSGARWIQAEHRVRPEELKAQTGYMQGAAGIGILLFHMDPFEKSGRIRFPDSPF